MVDRPAALLKPEQLEKWVVVWNLRCLVNGVLPRTGIRNLLQNLLSVKLFLALRWTPLAEMFDRTSVLGWLKLNL